MNFTSYLRRVPKVELRCHVDGSIRPGTALDLAARHGMRASQDVMSRRSGYRIALTICLTSAHKACFRSVVEDHPFRPCSTLAYS